MPGADCGSYLPLQSCEPAQRWYKCMLSRCHIKEQEEEEKTGRREDREAGDRGAEVRSIDTDTR